MSSEFYVGYLPKAPARIAARTRAAVLVVLVSVLAAAALVATSHRPLGAARYDFGLAYELTGVVRLDPTPVIEVERPGSVGDLPPSSTYPLVSFGKVGAPPELAPLDGRRVRLSGMLIYRDGETLVELVEGTLEALEGEVPLAPTPEFLGEATLQGEVVDSKCFFGVMNPGNLKTHRACATLCIRGGIPPVFCVRDAMGRARYLFLRGPAGEEIGERLLDFVAEPLEIRGEIVRYGDLLVLRTDPGALRRLP